MNDRSHSQGLRKTAPVNTHSAVITVARGSTTVSNLRGNVRHVFYLTRKISVQRGLLFQKQK